MKRSYLVLGSLCAILAVASVSLFATSLAIDSTPVEPITSSYDGFDYSWVDLDPYIAHAFGGVLDDAYTNSYEAFLLNYQLGHRIFEVDFFITDDGKTVAAHDDEHWRANTVIQNDAGANLSNKTSAAFTYANFMSSLWYGKYHPVDLDLLFDILQEYPDIYIVTDTKFFDEENVRKQFTAFVEAGKAVDITLLDRFIPQIYIPEMFDWIMDVYPWKSVIYTLYASPNWTPENVVEFTKESGVKYITIFYPLASQETLNLWQSANLIVGAHTINDFSAAEEAFTRGVQNIYTDYLLP